MATCNLGWKVSEGKSKCDANVCLCPNGVAPSGPKCTVDAANECQVCNSGFKLNEAKTACDGRSRGFVVTGMAGFA